MNFGDCTFRINPPPWRADPAPRTPKESSIRRIRFTSAASEESVPQFIMGARVDHPVAGHQDKG